MYKSLSRILVPLLALAVLSACGVGGPTPPSRYYLLTASPDLARQGAGVDNADLSISIGPIEVPSHLDRLEIVTKKSGHQLILAEFDLWAEPLDENVARILVENLSVLLGTDAVFRFEGRRGAPVDFEIAVDVEKMEAVVGDRAELVVRWTVIRSKGREHLFTRRTRYVAKLPTTELEAIAAGMSRNVAELSVEIAAAITQFAK